MSNQEGRGRPRRDYPSRLDEKSYHSRATNRPSRHLWVGNLPCDLTERDLDHYFLRFGDLETLAFQPGRSYAFVNYKNDEDAFAAIHELQGFVIGGNPIRIEFTKAEKSMIDAHYPERREEAHPRESSFFDRDSRGRRSSPESPYLNKSKKVSNKDAEPNEVLWVGFPAQLKIDEFILKKAFSPFGEIEKITSFPGRTFAFVRYRNVMAAYRAKEALHGKLFGNPRVHICFAANNESATSERGRNSITAPPSHYIESHRRSGSTEHLQSDGNFRGASRDPIPSTRSPLYLKRGRNDYHEQRFDSDIRSYERRNSPQRGMYCEYSAKQGPFNDNQRDLPEDVSPFHNTKRLKSSHSFYQENELPDYPFSDLGKVKHDPPHSISQSRSFEDRLISSNFMNTERRFGERGDNWNGTIDSSQVAPRALPPTPLTNSRSESASKVVWKWEGMFAKGGTPVCRAKGFPVGKSMDMDLPEYIDCTARTSLEMLQEHYYNEAASAWVVFFSPAEDADIVYYNEFMNYLSEKNRVAVAKLDEQTTLFLVPPSDFSEKVLKVAGELSLSGVILRLRPQYNGAHYEEKKKTTFSQTYLPNFSNYENRSGNLPSASTIPPSVESQGGHNSNIYLPKPPSVWDMQNSNPSTGNIGNLHSHNNYHAPDNQSSYPGGVIASEQLSQLTSSFLGLHQSGGEYIPSNQSSGYPSSSTATGSQNYYGLPNEQYQSTVPAQHQQFGQSQSQQLQQFGQMQQQQSTVPAQHQQFGQIQLQQQQLQQFGQMQQQQQQQQLQLQQSSNDLVAVPQREVQAVAAQVSRQFQNAEDSADAQVRLQATLQLAATLLQQIQQQKGN